jgi:hypothetical protein
MHFRKTIIILSLISLVFLSSSALALTWGDYEYTESGGNVYITKYIGTGGDVVIPDKIPDNATGKTVVSIGVSAFSWFWGLTSVTIPNSVTSIGNEAFEYCWDLTSVNIGSSVTSIGNSAFYGCTGLNCVTIPASVTYIGDDAFAGCTGLTTIVVDAGNTVYSSQDGVVYNNTKTTLILYPCGKSGPFTILSSVTSIGNSAFYYCSNLTSVTIPDSVTSIGNSAFYGCTGLTIATIGSSVTYIGDSAFDSCTGLTSVTIPNSVTGIGAAAFYGCTGLTSAYFYGNAPVMGYFVFYYCASGFTVYYTPCSTGFTNPWCPTSYDCYPTEVFSVSCTTTTTLSPTTTTTLQSTTTTTIGGGSTTTTIGGGTTTTTIGGGSTTTTIGGGSTTTTALPVDAPVAKSDNYTTLKNETLNIAASDGLLANDSGSNLTAKLATLPLHGDLGLNFDGSFIYIPTKDFVGTDNFTYTATDGIQNSLPAKVSIVVSKKCPATKVLGSDNPQLENLRFFRDSKLSKSYIGRRIIGIYYNNADSINVALESSPALRAVARRVLEVIAPMVGKN